VRVFGCSTLNWVEKQIYTALSTKPVPVRAQSLCNSVACVPRCLFRLRQRYLVVNPTMLSAASRFVPLKPFQAAA
jgi:hypothetical protein